jgi:uncharacterized sulfatase
MSYDGSKPQLYDLKADVGETTNLSAQHPEVSERLRRLIVEWNANLPSDAGDPQYAAP